MKQIASILLVLLSLAGYAQRPGLGGQPSTGGGSGTPGTVTADQVQTTTTKQFVTGQERATIAKVDTALANRVVKQRVTILTTNDYTNEDKLKDNKLDSLVADALGLVSFPYTLTSDGQTTTFFVPHGLGVEPATFTLQAQDEAAVNISYKTVNSSGITFYTRVSPPQGSFKVFVMAKKTASSGGGSGGPWFFSGDGQTTTFAIPHGLGVAPSAFTVDSGNPVSAGILNKTATSTHIFYSYPVAPPQGNLNGLVYWSARP